MRRPLSQYLSRVAVKMHGACSDQQTAYVVERDTDDIRFFVTRINHFKKIQSQLQQTNFDIFYYYYCFSEKLRVDISCESTWHLKPHFQTDYSHGMSSIIFTERPDVYSLFFYFNSSIPITFTILTFFPISSTGGFSHLCSLLKITMVV